MKPVPQELAHLREILSEELSQPVLVSSEAENTHSRYASTIIWQFEDRVHGLRNIRKVKKDTELLVLCNDLLALYKREAAGEFVSPQEFQALHARALQAWAVSGTRESKTAIATARKWAWLGARKWAWIATRGWTKTWNWLLAASRPNRTYADVAALVLAWSGAWKWSRFWENHSQRLLILQNHLD